MDQCLHEGNPRLGKCKGEIIIVENPITHRQFSMCEKHADWYYDQQQDVINRYPEVLQGGDDL